MSVLAQAIHLLPCVTIASLLRLIAQRPYWYALLSLPGTFLHELLHLAIGAILNANPESLRLWPRRRNDGQWELGAVGFRNLRWYNAAGVSLAPLLALPALWWMIYRSGFAAIELRAGNALYWYIEANLLLSAWPSITDWRIALRSWPLLAGATAGWWMWISRGG